MKTFEELNCWKKASALRNSLSLVVETFPSEERFRLSDQIFRASRSVRANIAEVYGRFHYQEYIRFCRQARGSLYELIDHLLVAPNETYITGDQLRDFRNQISDCLAVLNGFINYLKKAKLQNNIVNEPEEQYHLTINK